MLFTLCVCGNKYPLVSEGTKYVFYNDISLLELLYEELWRNDDGEYFYKCDCGSEVNVSEDIFH